MTASMIAAALAASLVAGPRTDIPIWSAVPSAEETIHEIPGGGEGEADEVFYRFNLFSTIEGASEAAARQAGMVEGWFPRVDPVPRGEAWEYTNGDWTERLMRVENLVVRLSGPADRLSEASGRILEAVLSAPEARAAPSRPSVPVYLTRAPDDAGFIPASIDIRAPLVAEGIRSPIRIVLSVFGRGTEEVGHVTLRLRSGRRRLSREVTTKDLGNGTLAVHVPFGWAESFAGNNTEFEVIGRTTSGARFSAYAETMIGVIGRADRIE